MRLKTWNERRKSLRRHIVEHGTVLGVGDVFVCTSHYGCGMFDSVDVFGYGAMSDNYFI